MRDKGVSISQHFHSLLETISFIRKKDMGEIVEELIEKEAESEDVQKALALQKEIEEKQNGQ